MDIRTTIKERACCRCGGMIKPGEKYARLVDRDGFGKIHHDAAHVDECPKPPSLFCRVWRKIAG